MNFEELRLGNCIKIKGFDYNRDLKIYDEIENYIISVDMIKYDRCGYKYEEFFFDEIEPIPLTEEWLSKLGFENETDEIDGKYYNIWFVNNTDYLIEHFISDNTYVFTDDCSLKISLNYIHQMQNLYFSLTGSELIFKDDEIK